MPSMWSVSVIRTNSDYCRAGIIPFCFKNDVLWFCLGIDKKSGELTDFGGGVKRRETPLEGAARELFEESDGMFNEYSNKPELNTLQSTICISGGDMTLIFLPVPNTFMNIKRNNISDEITSIVWLTKKDILNCINQDPSLTRYKKNMKYEYRMWKKLACFIRRNMKEFLNIMDKLDEFYWFK